MTITTEYVYPPIPIRSFDWRCFDSDSEESPIGWGATEALAIADFEDQLDANPAGPSPLESDNLNLDPKAGSH
jgi:hypothetical protein